MRILFPYIAYTCDDLCRITRDHFRSFGKGCRIIRRAEFLEVVRYLQCLVDDRMPFVPSFQAVYMYTITAILNYCQPENDASMITEYIVIAHPYLGGGGGGD